MNGLNLGHAVFHIPPTTTRQLIQALISTWKRKYAEDAPSREKRCRKQPKRGDVDSTHGGDTLGIGVPVLRCLRSTPVPQTSCHQGLESAWLFRKSSIAQQGHSDKLARGLQRDEEAQLQSRNPLTMSASQDFTQQWWVSVALCGICSRLLQDFSRDGIGEKQHERSDDEFGDIARPASEEQELARPNRGIVCICWELIHDGKIQGCLVRVLFLALIRIEDEGQQDGCYNKHGERDHSKREEQVAPSGPSDGSMSVLALVCSPV